MNIEKIQEHYDHARQKHPYFCDMVTRDLWKVKDVQENIARIRQYIAEDVKRHEVEALSLLICEMREFEEASKTTLPQSRNYTTSLPYASAP